MGFLGWGNKRKNEKQKQPPTATQSECTSNAGPADDEDSIEKRVRQLRQLGITVTERDIRFMRYEEASEEPNLNRRIQLLERVAEEGEAIACYDLGIIFGDFKETNGKRDWVKARKYLKKAADMELPQAMTIYGNLNLHYVLDEKEEITDEDQEIIQEGLHYLAMATKYGNGAAFPLLLEWMDSNTWFCEAVQHDLQQYTEELEQQSEKSGRNLVALGLYYMNGLYYEQDLEKAKQYFLEAKQLENVDAMIYLDNPIFEDD